MGLLCDSINIIIIIIIIIEGHDYVTTEVTMNSHYTSIIGINCSGKIKCPTIILRQYLTLRR